MFSNGAQYQTKCFTVLIFNNGHPVNIEDNNWGVFFMFYDIDQDQVIQEEAKTNLTHFLQYYMVLWPVNNLIL